MSDSDVLHLAVDELSYAPSDAQIRVKAAFWSRLQENPVLDPSQLTLTSVMRIVSDRRLDRWWGTPGFKEWFSNSNEFRERLELLAYKALERLEIIINQPTEAKTASAQVNAIKLLMEIGRKMPPKSVQQDKFLDEKISRMSKAELEDYIQRNLRLIPAQASK